MDAYSYLCRGEVFANAQTGNILLFGVNLSMGHWSKALQYVCPVLAFAIGIAAAEFVRRKFTNRKHVQRFVCGVRDTAGRLPACNGVNDIRYRF